MEPKTKQQEPLVLTEEQYQRFIAILNEVENIRRLSPEEKDGIVRGILESPYIDLTCDWAFKHVFGHHPELLMMLLNDLLPEKITAIEYDPNEVDRFSANDKNVIMDVFCHTEDGRRIVVEMQKEDHDGFHERMLYYGAARLREQLEVGEKYEELCPVYVICFMDFTLPHKGITVPPGKLIFSYRLMEEQTHEEYGRWLNILLCELPRLQEESLTTLSPQEQWFAVLRNLPNFAEKPAWLDARFDPLLDLARTRGLNDEEQVKYLRSMVSEKEKDSIARAYLRRGREEESLKNRENLLRIAKKLLEKGDSAEEIAVLLELPLEEVESL